jgi:hypothetical protein
MSKRQRAKYKDFKKRWGLQKAKHITSTEQIRLIAPIPRRQYSTNLVETGMIILKNAICSTSPLFPELLTFVKSDMFLGLIASKMLSVIAVIPIDSLNYLT